jgi:hypothetical protein
LEGDINQCSGFSTSSHIAILALFHLNPSLS